MSIYYLLRFAAAHVNFCRAWFTVWLLLIQNLQGRDNAISCVSLFNFNASVVLTFQAETALGILYTLVGSAAVFGNLCAIYYFTTIDKSIFYTYSY